MADQQPLMVSSDEETKVSVDEAQKDSGAGAEFAVEGDQWTVFEDNRAVPSHKSWRFLRGRTFEGMAQGLSEEDLSHEWVYQRFVNRFMHRFHEPKHPWYETRLLGGEVLVGAPASKVVALFTFLAPLFFPLVFTPTALFFLVVAALRPVKALGFLGRIPSRQLWATVLTSLWYSWITIPTWVYITTRNYRCDMDVTCDGPSFHVSGVTLAFPFMACMVSGFRFVHNVAVSAGGCACYAQLQNQLLDRRYGQGLHAVISTLSNRRNKFSYYPVFAHSECDSPEVPIEWFWHVGLVFLSLLHGLLPLVWMWQRHPEAKSMLPGPEAGLWAHALVWTSVVGIGVEVYIFFRSLHRAMLKYKNVVQEIFLFIYMGSMVTDKKRPHFWRGYGSTVKDLDARKKRYADVLDCECFMDKEGRCGERAHVQRSQSAKRTTLLRDESEAKSRVNELDLLETYQVQFNLSTVEGASFYKRLRRYICTDIMNERLEMDLFMTVVFLALFMQLSYLGFAWLFNHARNESGDDASGSSVSLPGLSAAWTVIPLNVCMLSYYGINVLQLCVNANLYLFDYYKRILLTWQEFLYFPETDFGEQSEEAGTVIGWRWSAEERGVRGGKPQPLDCGMGAKLNADRDAVSKVLELAARRVDLNEKPQSILGFEVTPTLQSRIIVSLGSSFAAIFLQMVKYLGENPAVLDKIWPL